jgi:adiponectin receptor
MVCLGGSALYHLFGTANSKWTSTLATADYAGVTALIVGSFIPIVHYGYHSTAELEAIGRRYTGLLVVLGSIVLALSASDFFHDERLRALRVGLYIGLGFSGVFPIGHALALRGLDPVTWLMLYSAATNAGMYLLGCVFYLSRFPEAVAPPGMFDRLGSSHNIWHLMIVLAATAHYVLLLELWHAAHAAHAASTCADAPPLPAHHRQAWEACDVAMFAD